MRISEKNTALCVTSTQSGHAGESEFSPSVADFMPSCQGQSLSLIVDMLCKITDEKLLNRIYRFVKYIYIYREAE